MKRIGKYFLSISVMLGIIFTLQAHAEVSSDDQGDPYKVVQKTTEEVLTLIADAKSYYQKEPERFHKEVTVILDRVVDFDSFARGVMGTYASGQRFKTLKTDAEKEVFNRRIQTFSSTFKQGLVDTYASGLLKFKGQKIETLPSRKGDNVASGAVIVAQNIYNDSGKPYVVQYSMRRNSDGRWKLYNLSIEGVNLGLTYRSQFAESADLNKGDIDKVVATWKVDPQSLDKDKAALSDVDKAAADDAGVVSEAKLTPTKQAEIKVTEAKVTESKSSQAKATDAKKATK